MLSRRRGREAGAPSAGDAGAAYDEVPYPGAAFKQTHPDRLATLARLYGGRPGPLERCRVLELGCGDGGNLLPLGYALPKAEFVGIDLNEPAIERGRATAAAVGLANVRLDAGDIAALDARRLGRFDYVVAHGVFSWVPEEVRHALLEVCRACLEREGVAFVSFNALPGGHLRRALREALHFEVAGIRSPDRRIEAARALLRRLRGATRYDGELGREVQRTLDSPDAIVYHDALAEIDTAFSITTFAAAAAEAGLRYLCEADFHEGLDGAPLELARELDEASGDRIAREQRLDVLTLRLFRQALLVRADARAGEQPDAGAVRDLRIASSLRPGRKLRLDAPTVDEFRSPEGGTLRTDDPLFKAALLVLGEVWPRSLPFAELAAAAGARRAAPGGRDDATLAATLLEAFRLRAVEFHVWEPPVAATPGERPLASALARHQAEAGATVATLRQATVEIEDERGRRLLTLLDGTRDHEQLAAALRLDSRATRELPGRLKQLAALGLLEEPGAR
jgi:methyltransferase-like protein